MAHSRAVDERLARNGYLTLHLMDEMRGSVVLYMWGHSSFLLFPKCQVDFPLVM